MQNVLALETKKYSIKIENFEGPLDLLCHLIDKNKMDIYDINLSEITDQYIEFIKQMEQMNLDVTSEFLVMSSTLLYLKSKHLLPKTEDDEEEITEEELIRRIIEYKKYKEITTGSYLDDVLAEGAQKASYHAKRKLSKVERKIGITIKKR